MIKLKDIIHLLKEGLVIVRKKSTPSEPVYMSGYFSFNKLNEYLEHEVIKLGGGNSDLYKRGYYHLEVTISDKINELEGGDAVR